jgi:non-heme chloroperoxidase
MVPPSMTRPGHVTTADGTRLRVRDVGQGDDTIVLVHGWKGSHRLWDKVVVALMARHRVVTYDLRGMGESDKPADGYDFDTYASDLGTVLEGLDVAGDVTLVGWSMGCTISLSYMEAGGAGVDRLVLLNGPLRLTQAPDFPHAMPAEQFEGYLDELVRNWPASERAFQHDTVLEDDQALKDFMYQVALQTPLDAALAIVRSQVKTDMREAVKRLRVPVLAAYSDGDPYYPTSLADWIAAEAPDGQRAELHASAHATPLEEPEAFAAAVEAFIASRHKT